MLISHEVPLSLLEYSTKFNDYDYCLLHLTYESEEYKNFYLSATHRNRPVLLDNSLFELGDALTGQQLADGVRLFKPTWYVVPDCLNNKTETIKRFSLFRKSFPDLPGLAVGVVHGNTVQELSECYSFMSTHADKIAIPFDSKAFDELSDSSSQLERWCYGRRAFIQGLVDRGLWNSHKPHHLLGCSLAKEFSNSLYNTLSIESVDTSNPVVAGIVGLRYGTQGLEVKPSVKLCDLISTTPTPQQLSLILHNVKAFRTLCSPRHWICFFSQTGSEIFEVSKALHREPDLIITNRETLDGVSESFLTKYRDRVIYIPNKPVIQDYTNVMTQFKELFTNCIVTLHGFLRILPPEVCSELEVYNLHPGLITKCLELRGFNPQEKAFKMHLSTSGVVIHEVTARVDEGPVLLECECSIQGLSLDEVYAKLHDLGTAAWCAFLKNRI